MDGHTKFDIVLIFISVLLLATLAAFFIGIFPYPYGFIVLSIALIGRVLQLHSKH